MSVVNVKIIHLRPQYNNLKEWMENPDHVYIGRKGIVFIDNKRFPEKDSLWCNPFKIGKDGSREEILDMYREYIEEKIEKECLGDELRSLKGKVLGCWCSPQPCHGDILVELINSHIEAFYCEDCENETSDVCEKCDRSYCIDCMTNCDHCRKVVCNNCIENCICPLCGHEDKKEDDTIENCSTCNNKNGDEVTECGDCDNVLCNQCTSSGFYVDENEVHISITCKTCDKYICVQCHHYCNECYETEKLLDSYCKSCNPLIDDGNGGYICEDH